MSFSRMMRKEGDTWEDKRGEQKRGRRKKREYRPSTFEELFQSGRSHLRIPDEYSSGKSLGEVRLRVSPNERRKFHDLARG